VLGTICKWGLSSLYNPLL